MAPLRSIRSIRGRLTAWLALLIALCLATFTLFLYVAVRDALVADLDHTLRAQAQQVAAAYDFNTSSSAENTGQQMDGGAIAQVTMGGVVVDIFDARGRLLARAGHSGSRHLPLPAPIATLRARPDATTQPAQGGPWRLYSLPVTRDGQRVGLVVVAASLREIAATMQALLLLLAGGGLAVTALAALGSGVLVRHGLRPLGEMAAVAESITAQRLDQRLVLRDPPQEVARLAATFDAMLERLHEAFAAQRRFVADASHELRTPLATLRGRGDVLLLNPALDEETREGLTMMRDEAARMGRLVANLLLLARGDEAWAIDRRPVELDVVLLEVARQARALAHGVTVALGHEDQAMVLGDADLLKQVLLNLVDNALTYTPSGGHIALSLYGDDTEVRCVVRDNGPGIAPADLPRIFERFYRPDRARSRRSGGAGLGLAIARGIVEAHGGTIAVESAIGTGSAFTVALPRLGAPQRPMRPAG